MLVVNSYGALHDQLASQQPTPVINTNAFESDLY